ncbi:MAG TPA: ATP-binding cassette domain-containing protein, partial [Flavitalea sp.]|nr:ATP-binding cassette domain-containing protein [Flavitalea sp.]
MMKISLSDAGKRFNRDWIFRRFNYSFEPGNAYAITGANGSGKSTLLQVIAGAMTLSAGSIEFSIDNRSIDPDLAFRSVSMAAPYMELIEEMSAIEFLEFHNKFKPFLPGKTVTGILGEVQLISASKKQIRYYSSGMKQRVKLAQAIFSASSCLLLDEPCTNLDVEGINL